jgi:hypothetical protein
MINNYTTNFIVHGFVDVSTNTCFDKNQLSNLYLEIQKTRKFDKSLFIEKPNNLESLSHRGVNPKSDSQNLLLSLDTSFIEENRVINDILKQILGDYKIHLKKIVCGLPDTCIPNWVIEIVKDQPVPNLGAYIDKKYQDITYFRGIDWHQDIIDYPQHDPRFITLYIYLHDVGSNDAPLWVIPKSHLLGATKFPHNIKALQGRELIYTDDEQKNSLTLNKFPLIGEAGSVYFWHSNTLHGTTQVNSLSPRISLRYLIKRENNLDTILPIDIITQSCLNNSSAAVTRVDVDNLGRNIKSGNIIKGII